VQRPVTAPSAQDAALILNTRRVGVASRGADEKTKAVSEALKQKGLPVPQSLTPGAPVTLTMAAARSGEAHLLLFKPLSVNFSKGAAQFNGAANWSEGSLWVVFTPAAPGRYLFDFALDENATLGKTVEYNFFSLDGAIKQTSQTIPAAGHAVSQVSFLVELPDAKPRTFIFHADNGYTFYQCEITPFK
jgi:hypothetical protein